MLECKNDVVSDNDELRLLKQDIDKKRLELHEILKGANDFLTDNEVVQISQQLDHLLVRYIRFSIEPGLKARNS